MRMASKEEAEHNGGRRGREHQRICLLLPPRSLYSETRATQSAKPYDGPRKGEGERGWRMRKGEWRWVEWGRWGGWWLLEKKDNTMA